MTLIFDLFDLQQNAMALLNAKLDELRILEDSLGKLQMKLNKQKEEFETLKADHEMCGKKLQRATDIITGLGGEKTRWTDAAEELANVYDTLTGDVLIASGVVAYLGPFTTEYRTTQMLKWAQRCSDLGMVCDLYVHQIMYYGHVVFIKYLLIGISNCRKFWVMLYRFARGTFPDCQMMHFL